jgi:membrane protein implicated in regulation of membrane protease activity
MIYAVHNTTAYHLYGAAAHFGRLVVAMLAIKRPQPARAVVILLIAGTAICIILAGAWYYLDDWSFFITILLLVLFGDDLLALLLLSSKTEHVALTGKEAMIGQIATVVGGFAPAVGLRTVCGKVRLNGEFWSAEADRQQRDGLAVGRKVRIRYVEGLTLIVEPEQASKR